jgi:lipoic acid synthetase
VSGAAAGGAARPPLRARWLGRAGYQDALALQHALRRSAGEYLLLLEHPHVYTLGVRARPEHLLVAPELLDAELVRADRGGDVTYHGPGQLVGYAILDVPLREGAIPAHVHALEQLVIEALADLGLPGAGRRDDQPGVWLDATGPSARKICAVGVRVSRGRSMHGFALNVAPDLARFARIVPCGIADKPVTSLAAEGVAATMVDAVEAVLRRAGEVLRAPDGSARRVERQGVPARRGERDGSADTSPVAATAAAPAASRFAPPAPGPGPAAAPRASRPAAPATAPSVAAGPVRRPLELRLAAAGVDPDGGVAIGERKPSWLRVNAHMGDDFLALRRTMRDLRLVTVCEEAGCPNIYECWADGTATFMINGERCTRACGFCLVDTRHPLPLDAEEPERVAEAVASMRLAHAVVTAVARDDLADGGAAAFAETIQAVRRRSPGTAVEVLIPDCKGDEQALRAIFDARPDVLNHNLETVLRLQRAVRPSASYARSLAVLARAASAGLTTKSGIILGMGETAEEVLGALADLRNVGVQIVTLGQYLRPSAQHLPVARWWRPDEIADLGAAARAMGFAHVEASPLTRSSYHARRAAEHAAGAGGTSAPVVSAAGARPS